MPAIEIRGKGKRLFPRSSVGTINNRPQKSPAAKRNAGPAKRTVRGMTGLRGRKQPFGAEPGGGVRNREQGANCLSAASFCPAGSAARRPGSSQRQGCPFFWFFSLGRQRKERLPARGRGHSGDAGASWSTFPRWRVGTIKRIKRLRQGRCNIIAGMARSYYTTGRPAGEGYDHAVGCRAKNGRVDYCVVAGSAAGATGLMRILSTRVLSMSTTSKRKPCSSKWSASSGMRPSTWMTKPPRVW